MNPWLLRFTSLLLSVILTEIFILQINVLNIQHAIYLENTIPMRDRVAFTCVLKEDMNLFIKIIRDKLKLRINVLHSSTHVKLHEYQPKISLKDLKQYGFHSYLNTLFVAPNPIMTYLCKTYRIHNIPVGNSQTNMHFGTVPKEIVLFFSGNVS